MVRLCEPRGAVRLRVGAVGDIGLVGSARARAREHGYAALFAPIAAAFEGLPLTFANLEFPVADPTWVLPGRTPEFWHEPGVAEGLAAAHVRVVSLANNHMMDAGERGLRRTLEACRAAGLLVAGAGDTLREARAPARLEIAGRRVTLLAYASVADSDRARDDRPGCAPLEAALVKEDVARWRGESDVLVVSAHWGSMYVEHPPERVVTFADELARAGVDLVLGHHPHVLQGFRRQERTLTLFSMGDAAFNSRSGELSIEWTHALRAASGVFVASLADEHGLDVHPMTLDDDGVPHAADAAAAEATGARLAALSADWDGAADRFGREAATSLVRYEMGALKEYLRRGQLLRAAKLLGSVRPRHLATLWNALRAKLVRGSAR